MATFPESPVPFYPLEVVEIWDTLVSRMESGTEQRRQRQLFPIYDVTVTYDVLSAADCETLWQFYSARKGAYEAFYIYDLALLASVAFSHKAQYCGTGNGTIDTFDIPGRSTSSQTIYLDGASQASGYSILTGGGASNADRVQFTTPPASGVVVSADFTGYLRIRARFAEDRLSRILFTTNLLRYQQIALKGLKAA